MNPTSWPSFHCSLCALLLSGGLVALQRTGQAAATVTSGERLTRSAISHLQQKLDRGEVQLQFEHGTGYLQPLLKSLDIPVESQLLVFSKTSCQRDKISPQTPRAIYFNDEAYVAWIPGSSMIEISGVVPGAGAVFHTLNQKEQFKPQLTRRDQCLECHTSSKTEGVPGYLVRSYATDGKGIIDITEGYSMVDHATPLAERWGGWYICGSPGGVEHRGIELGDGNSVRVTNASHGSLEGLVDLSLYPQRTSDIVALMVLEHQARMQNLLTRLQFDSTSASSTRWKSTAETVLRYLLFIDEVPLRRPIQAAREFATKFERRGTSDKHGRSLRRFNLQTRLFEYPCSYMIYSESFDTLPRETKLHLYRRLWTILNGEDPDPIWTKLPAETRQAIREILIETKRDVPFYWKL